VTPRQPNILVVVADQLAASALGAYGNRVTRAPTLDRLGTEGVVFDSAYCASPLCVPSRGAFMSGMLPSRNGAFDNGAELAASIPTFAHYLRVLGYRTVLAGKMHFVGPDQMHGFEQRVTADVYPAGLDWVPDWRLASNERLPWYHDMSSVERAGPVRASLQLDYDEEVAFRARRAIIDSARAQDDRPLLLVASFTHPHDPYEVPRRLWERYADDEIELPRVAELPFAAQDAHSRRLLEMFDHERFPVSRERLIAARRAYAAAVSLVDEHVASLLATLDDLRMRDDTIVVVISDHGDMLGERGLWYKMSFFEGSARVPFIVHHPASMPARRVVEPISLLDLAPTLVELAGGWPDGAPSAPIDGHSRAALVRGGGEPPDEPVLGEYLSEGVTAPQVMVRRGSKKLIRCPGDPDLLYDLDDDPDELHNLAAVDDAAHEALGRVADARWDLGELRTRLLESQQSRRLVVRALGTGAVTTWDHRVPDDGPDRYISSGRDFWGSLEQARLPDDDQG
jgi:choline-sulfatase